MKIEGLCKIEDIKFGNYTVRALPSNIDDIECSGGVFYFIGSQKFVKDHGLGEHFKWLNKYYSGLDVIPLALPTRQMNVSNKVFQRIKTLSGKTLIIASVDFSHYKSESIAKRNDEISYFTLNSTGTLFDISKLDVDCPSCLGVIYLLAKENNKRIQQWYRDSSSTIVGYDLKEKNTSRLFLWWSK